MGSGKSTIGRQLARNLGLEFVDCDEAIERRTGASISLIFDIEGEEGFRRRERAMLDELTARRGIVLATGGGAVLDPDNRARLHERGRVIYLSCSVPQQYERTRHSRHRPLLQAPDPQGRLADLLEIRDPLYREVAHLIVDTDSRTVGAVVRDLVRMIESTNGNGTVDGARHPGDGRHGHE